MDPETAFKRFEDLKKELDAVYTRITFTVVRLPVPMRLPAWDEDQPLVLRSLDLAWDLLGEEPLSEEAVSRAREMITAWVTAYELGIVATASGPAPWRLRAIETALGTSRRQAYLVGRYLDWHYGISVRKPW